MDPGNKTASILEEKINGPKNILQEMGSVMVAYPEAADLENDKSGSADAQKE